jgi:glycosyltransferase involved in cell wall biosynthesis
MQNLVSVIIPTYNRAEICRQAVNSVLSQTHSNVEVIVIDDESSDNTREIISNLDSRVRYIWQKNAGVSAARNHGMRLATGDFIAFLDDDDIWHPFKLEAQLSVFKYYPEVGMIWTDMRAVDPEGKILYDSYLHRMYGAYRFFNADKNFSTTKPLGEIWTNCPENWRYQNVYKGNIFSWMFMGSLVHTSTVILRRKWQKEVGGFDESLLISGEDYDFHFRTCRLGDVSYINITSIDYRIGASDQLSNRKYLIYGAQNNLKTIKKMYKVAHQEINLPKNMIHKRMAEAHSWAGREEFYAGQKGPITNLLKSLRYDPFQLHTFILFILSLMPRSVYIKLKSLKNIFKRILAYV